MDSESRIFFNIAGIVVLICLTMLGGCHLSYQHKETMAELGYAEMQNIGDDFTRWVPVPKQEDERLSKIEQTILGLAKQTQQGFRQVEAELARKKDK
jgi:hypothetical protein